MSRVVYIVSNLLAQVLPPPKPQRQPRQRSPSQPSITTQQRRELKRLIQVMREEGYQPPEDDEDDRMGDG